MTNVQKSLHIAELSKKFPEAPKEALPHLHETGLVYYTLNSQGQKVYGLPKTTSPDSPILSELYTGPGETQQQFRDDADINSVLKKYGVHDNYVPADIEIPLQYFRDLSMRPTEFTESLNVIAASNQAFMELPAHLRRAVNDDPRRLLELSQTPDGLRQLEKLGFGPPPEAPNSDSEALEAQEPVSAPKKSKNASKETPDVKSPLE